MELNRLDALTKNELAEAYRLAGMLVVPSVLLPTSFTPRKADVVFLKTPGGCEVYFPAQVAYWGEAPEWQQIQAGPRTPGRTRKVAQVRGDLFTALNETAKLLERAGDGVPSDPEPFDAPLEEPDQEHRQLPNRHPQDDRSGRPPVLRNLVQEAQHQPQRLVGREDLLRSLKANLLRETKPGSVLIGRPGVGKTTVVEMLASQIADGVDIPEALQNAAIYDLPLGALVEGARYVGDIERHLRRIIEMPGRPIFFLDEIHQLARPEIRPVCDLVKPALATGTVRVIGATTPTDWRALTDNAFKRRFLELTVDEPTPTETLLMLQARVAGLQEHHSMRIDESLIREAIMLGARYMPMRCFPDKAIDVLDQAAALQALTKHSDQGPVPHPHEAL